MRTQARLGCSFASIVLGLVFRNGRSDPSARISRAAGDVPLQYLDPEITRRRMAATLDFGDRGALGAQVPLDEIQLEKQFLDLGHAQALGIMRGVVVERRYFLLALGEIHGVVEIPVVGGDAIILLHVLDARHLLARNQRLVEFFAVTRTDRLYRIVGVEKLF